MVFGARSDELRQDARQLAGGKRANRQKDDLALAFGAPPDLGAPDVRQAFGFAHRAQRSRGIGRADLRFQHARRQEESEKEGGGGGEAALLRACGDSPRVDAVRVRAK